MGDFYLGGSRGDPFWGGLFGAVKRIGGALLGAPLGGGAPKMLGSGAMGTLATRGGKIVAAVKSGIIKHPVLSAAGAAGAIGMLGGAAAEKMLAAGDACPKGFHISKSKHSKSFGACVRNRHMNPCNPRALRRAVRRATRFTHLAMKTIHLVHPKKKGRFGGFRKRKRAA